VSPPLPKYLAASCALLIAWACLYPFSGWQASGLPVFDYLFAPWPRYIRAEDLVVNILGYVPLGFVLVPALPRRLSALAAIAGATLLAATLSLSIETTQNFLPTRISSNVDLGCNTLGALLGAVAGAIWGRPLFDRGGGILHWRAATIVPGRTGDLGLVLIGLWLLAQFMPDASLFSAGDLRRLLGLPTPMSFQPRPFITLEAAMVATSLLAIGLFVRCMMQVTRAWPFLLVLALGVAAKATASWLFYMPGDALLWLTPGTRNGLLAGTAMLACALWLPRVHQHALAGMALLGAAMLANLMPENPYLAGTQRLISGNFQNFHGLVRVISGAWPFFALAYLSALGLWRGEHLHDR
jgi:VanZ family protein